MSDEIDNRESEDAGGRLLTATRRSHLRRIAHILGILVLLIIVIPFVIYAVPQVVGAEQSYVVLSGSMEPALSPGDVAVIEDVDASTVEAGDVINFRRPSERRTTTHRVLEVVEQNGEPAFQTKGDNNEDPDREVVTADQLEGKLMTVGGYPVVFPLVGYVILFASTQTGFALLFIIPVVLLIANEIWNVISSARSQAGRGESPNEGADGSATFPEELAEAGDPVRVESLQEDVGEWAEDESPRSDSGGITFRPAELRLGALILGVFGLYSVGITLLEPGVWTIGIAASVIAAFFLVGGLYMSGRLAGDSSGNSSPEGSGRTDVVIKSEVPSLEEDEGLRLPVPTLATLVDLASTRGGRIYRDPDSGAFYLSAGSTVYLYVPDGVVTEPTIDDGSGATDPDSDEKNTPRSPDGSASPEHLEDPLTEADDD